MSLPYRAQDRDPSQSQSEQVYTTTQDEKRQSTIEALTKLYRLYTKLPYIPQECLMIPPETGWTTIDEVELRKRGKSASVIDMLRHLPYMKQKGNAEKWSLTWSTLHINYAEGEMYNDWIEDQLLEVPSHVICLTGTSDIYGIYWLLDTETQEMIEFNSQGDTLELGHEESEAIPADMQWKIQTRMPAADYFELWRHKHEILDFLIIPHDRPFQGRLDCFSKGLNHLWEESLWQSDDGEVDEDYDEDRMVEADLNSGSSEEAVDDDLDEEDPDWEILEDANELEWLEKDKTENQFLSFGRFQDGNPSRIPIYPLEGCHRSRVFSTGAPGQEVKEPPSDYLNGPWGSQAETIGTLLTIFIQNGWPLPPPLETISAFRPFPVWGQELDVSGFDREKCYADLITFMQELQRKTRERLQQDTDEMALQLKTLLLIRHKLQRMLLKPTPSDDELSEASGLLDGLNNSFYETQSIQQSKVLKILSAVLQMGWIDSDAHSDLKSKINIFLENTADLPLSE